ncbi:MAG: amidohydrolase [Burkholderiaceae bacterium]|nr:amidohydrolase [Burkholderiaceae bacterium]
MSELNVVELYKSLHEMAELSRVEFKTTAFLKDHMTRLGYKIGCGFGPNDTGFIAEIEGSEPGPTMLLRADIDALPFTVDGQKVAIHACGHDSHSAMVLAAASRVNRSIKRGKLKVLFQPAEETLAGALDVLEKGVTDDCDIGLSVHNRPIQDCADGKMAAAVNFSSCTVLCAEVTGRSCHASRPHLGINCAEMLVAICQNISMLKFDPTKTWSCKVTNITVGNEVYNNVPNTGKAFFDVRAESNPLMAEIIEKVKNVIESTAAMYGGTGKLVYTREVVPAPDYDPELVEEVAQCIKEVVGEENYQPVCYGGGEDFFFYKKHKPSMRVAYFGVGAGCAPGLHDQNMKLNPESLQNGVEVMVKMINKHLG